MKTDSKRANRLPRVAAMMTAAICLFAIAERVVAQGAPFTVTSPKFADGGTLEPRNARVTSGTSSCGGDNVSPPLAWSNAPAATKTFAIVMSDPDGGRGLGSVHWVAYDIAPTVTSVGEGEGTLTSTKFVGGTNSGNLQAYYGPCPPVGEAPHHYHFSVYALDIAAGELAPGLTRDALFAKIKGHILAQASIIARFAR
jgi:Raf kinase inhibitor-like YbhB/YbcL family protein